MNWEEEHKSRIASFPDNVREAHHHSSYHRSEIEGSVSCGCFYCTTAFAPETVVEWIDENSMGVGQTALCPKCGIDSVIGDKSGFPITVAFLSKMRGYWFQAEDTEQQVQPDREKRRGFD